MDFFPIERMWERVKIAKDDNDMSYFMNLTYLAEMMLKIVVAGMTAAIGDDRQNNRYAIVYKLVRADGLGEWSTALDEIISGPPGSFLFQDAVASIRQLTEKSPKGTWQFDACEKLNKCIDYFDLQNEPIPFKIDLRFWFKGIVRLRNLTKAHGAPQGGECAQICADFETSIKLIYDNLLLFSVPWAYLHRNYSGKYRVSKISENTNPFEFLKKSSSGTLQNFENGVYIYWGDIRNVELMQSDPDLFDFYFPNGLFSKQKYELLSYITNNRSDGDSSKYIIPASELPPSETDGKSKLDIIGKVFSNIPQPPIAYISRPELENQLFDALISENHPIITLRGRGGIGKTWLTLTVLQEISKNKKYDAIIWFSARDIDLLASGPKRVKPQVLDENDIANEFLQLIQPFNISTNNKPKTFFEENLRNCQLGNTLFIFDNFETVKHPAELYFWLDTYIRLPNKILITTRVREFKADFDLEVNGMSEIESELLINRTAKAYGVEHLLTKDYIQNLISESEGHPYVIKIMVGEVAKAKELLKVQRVVASSDDMLKSLFERTFNNLSPASKRVFLTLVGVHTVIPQIAIEAVLLRPENERINVQDAMDELEKSSFIEISKSKTDKQQFLSVPLAAVIFGEKKLNVSPYKSAIQSDCEILIALGETTSSDVKSGLNNWVEKLFRNIAEKINQNPSTFDNYIPILEFIANKHSYAWLLLASLYEETSDDENHLKKARDSVRRYLEEGKSTEKLKYSWRQMATFNRRLGDWMGEVHALVELSQFPNVDFDEISNSANRLNSLLKDKLEIESEEKRILGLKLLEVMEKRMTIGNGTDYSRMAWLAINIGKPDTAKEFIESGLQIDPENVFIQSMARKFGIL